MTRDGLRDPDEVQKATEATATVTGTAAPTPAPDPLLALEQELLDNRRTADELLNARDAGVPDLDNAISANVERWKELLDKIENDPVTTLEGVAVKVRRILAASEIGTLEESEQDLARTALEGLERLTQGVQGTEPDPVVALVAEWQKRRQAYLPYRDAAFGTPECEKGESLTAKVGDTEYALLEATPTTPQGVALLWQFMELDVSGDENRTALRNLRKALGQLGVRYLDGVRDDVTQIKELWGEGES